MIATFLLVFLYLCGGGAMILGSGYLRVANRCIFQLVHEAEVGSLVLIVSN